MVFIRQRKVPGISDGPARSENRRRAILRRTDGELVIHDILDKFAVLYSDTYSCVIVRSANRVTFVTLYYRLLLLKLA